MVRQWLAVGGAYLALRLALVATVDPFAGWPDTAGYKGAVSFAGNAERPWLIPLLQAALPDRAMMLLHAAVSAVAFVALAYAIGSQMRHRAVRYASAVVILLVGLSARVTVWDRVMLAESLAISLTVLLIAALAMLDRWPRWVPVVVFVAWVFCRDADALLGVCVAVGVCVWGGRRREWVTPTLIVVVAVWGMIAAQNDKWVEGYNATTLIAWRLDDNAWFIDHGMPDVPAADWRTRKDPDQLAALWADPTFRDWAEHHGVATYVRYALEHPSYLVSGLPHLWTAHRWPNDPSMLQQSTLPPGDQPASIGWAWPSDPRLLLMAIALATAILALVAVRAGRMEWRRWTLPALLAGSTVPHALLVYHASGIELNRHSVVVGMVLMVAAWWMLAVGVDQLVSEPAVRAGGVVDGGQVNEATGPYSDMGDPTDEVLAGSRVTTPADR